MRKMVRCDSFIWHKDVYLWYINNVILNVILNDFFHIDFSNSPIVHSITNIAKWLSF